MELNGQLFEIIKPARLKMGMVLRSGNTYARVGNAAEILEEQQHTQDLYNRGFPVAKVLEYGELPDGQRYFTEESLGEQPFLLTMRDEFRATGTVSDATFTRYLHIIEAYQTAQVAITNRTTGTPQAFREALVPHEHVLPTLEFFNIDTSEYRAAIARAETMLQDCPAGILQFDFNPYNVLPGGLIDFELVGHGPIGYDTLISARWAQGWFTSYPSRYPLAFRLSNEQLAASDALVDGIAEAAGLPRPTKWLDTFIFLKSAWAFSDFTPPNPDWPADKLAFRKFRLNVLLTAITEYLADKPLSFTTFCDKPDN